MAIKKKKIGSEAISYLANCEHVMRGYLIDVSKDLDFIENHIFFFEDIQSTLNTFKAYQPHASIHRSIAGYTVVNIGDNTHFTITNLLGILMITFFKKNKLEIWENTQINNGSGRITAKNQIMDSIVAQELVDITKKAEESKNRLSDTQRKKIKKKIEKAGDDVLKYAIMDDIIKDKNLEKANSSLSNNYLNVKGADRNKPCSCGSGKKLKHCCWDKYK